MEPIGAGQQVIAREHDGLRLGDILDASRPARRHQSRLASNSTEKFSQSGSGLLGLVLDSAMNSAADSAGSK